MPERRRGRDPQKTEFIEQDPLLYHIGARYPSEQTSEDAYDGARNLIAAEPCDLSTYRFAVMPDSRWHVAVLGVPPGPELIRRIETILLATGERWPLPDDVLLALQHRRLEQSQRGQFVERRSLRRTRRR